MGIKVINLRKYDVSLYDDKEIIFESLSPVTRFFFIINKLTKEIETMPEYKDNILFFRGQANSEWKVLPGIFRNDCFTKEHEIIRTSISRNPNVFSNNIDFSLLSKLQHYGLPTRLLDVTNNPLVALYFACDKENNNDGAVFIKITKPFYPDSNQTQILSYLSSIDLEKNHIIYSIHDPLIKKLSLKHYSINDFLLYIEANSKSHFVKADMNNERIIRQSGAFLLCGCIKFEKNNNEIKELHKFSEDQQYLFNFKIIINRNEKDSILKELDILNINESTLFPELEHQLNYVKWKELKFPK
jgi:hypothetical protein